LHGSHCAATVLFFNVFHCRLISYSVCSMMILLSILPGERARTDIETIPHFWLQFTVQPHDN